MTTLDLLIEQGIKPKKVSATNGGEYQSPCPLCGGKDRFHTWPRQRDNGTYWCRKCGIGGDAIQFLIDVCRLSFPESCKKLGKALPQKTEGQTPQYRHPATNTWQPRETNTPKDMWQRQAEKFTTWAHEQLLKNEAQLKYLADRGITKESAIQFRLGYNPDDYFREKKTWGIEDNGKKLWLPKGIVIPYYQDDILKRLRIRRQEGEPRYYVAPGSSMDTFIFNPDARAFAFVESELDAILIAQEAGNLIGSIGLGSAQAHPTKHAADALKNSLHILNALDFDDAGKLSSVWWKKNYPQTERWPVPQGKDPGDFFMAGGNIREWIISGLPPGLRPQPINNEELEKKYREAYDRLKWGTWLSQPEIKKADDIINDTWIACLDGKATRKDFENALTTIEARVKQLQGEKNDSTSARE